MAGPDLEQVMESLRALFAAEYHRGAQDAIARIMRAAQGEPSMIADAADLKPPENRRERKTPVPKGTAKALIDRVLSENGSRGATPSEIKAAAMTSLEKSVSVGGLKFALAGGKEDQRYRNRHGKWFLAAPRASHEVELPRSNSR